MTVSCPGLEAVNHIAIVFLSDSQVHSRSMEIHEQRCYEQEMSADLYRPL